MELEKSPTQNEKRLSGFRHKAAAKPWSIFLVEDNPEDVILLVEAFQDLNAGCELNQFKNGEELFQSLTSLNHLENILLVLDMRLPGDHGIQILKKIRENSRWKNLPVVVWTSYLSEKEMSGCTSLGIQGYVLKPRTWYEFVETAKYLGKFMANEKAAPPVWVRPLGSVQLKKGRESNLDPAGMSLIYITAALHASVTALETQMDTQSWEKPIRCALLLKTAWEGIRACREALTDDHNLYNAIELQTPYLSKKVQKLRTGLASLESMLNGLLYRLDSFSGNETVIWTSIFKETKNAWMLAKLLSENECDLIYENLATELSAQD